MSLHTPETIVCIYALNYIGAIANMVYLTLSEKEILQTLETTKSRMLFVLDLAVDLVSKIKDSIFVPVVVLGIADSFPLHMKWGYRLKSKPSKHGFMTIHEFFSNGIEPAPMDSDHAARAIIVYTSGTTGTKHRYGTCGNYKFMNSKQVVQRASVKSRCLLHCLLAAIGRR